jgi:hypothetical protein
MNAAMNLESKHCLLITWQSPTFCWDSQLSQFWIHFESLEGLTWKPASHCNASLFVPRFFSDNLKTTKRVYNWNQTKGFSVNPFSWQFCCAFGPPFSYSRRLFSSFFLGITKYPLEINLTKLGRLHHIWLEGYRFRKNMTDTGDRLYLSIPQVVWIWRREMLNTVYESRCQTEADFRISLFQCHCLSKEG